MQQILTTVTGETMSPSVMSGSVIKALYDLDLVQVLFVFPEQRMPIVFVLCPVGGPASCRRRAAVVMWAGFHL